MNLWLIMAELSLWLRSFPFLNQYFRKAAFLLPKLKTWPSVFKKTKVKTEKNAFSSTNYFLNEDKSCINRSILLCISSREPIWLCVVCITFYCWEIFLGTDFPQHIHSSTAGLLGGWKVWLLLVWLLFTFLEKFLCET